MPAASLDDYRLLARRRLPRFLFEYIDGGSYAEETMRANVDDMQRIHLRQRVMTDVSAVDLSTTMMGQRCAIPVALAPVGLAGLYARRGEVQAAQAAEHAGIPFILSSSAACDLDEVRAGVSGPFPFQLYMIKDRGFMVALLSRAAAIGIDTLVLTVDLIMHSPRHRDVRTGLTGPQDLAARLSRAWQIVTHPAWAWDVGVRGRPHTLGNYAAAMPGGAGLPQFTDWVSRNFDPSISWHDLDWLRAHWQGRIVLKGILDPEDADTACKVGAEGIIVSNHGGRQLDGALSSIAALPGVVERVAGRSEVLMDGGVRSGIDIVRALGLGARGVLIGRPWGFALAAGGRPMVTRMLDQLRHELAVAMALAGQTDVKTVSDNVISRVD